MTFSAFWRVVPIAIALAVSSSGYAEEHERSGGSAIAHQPYIFAQQHNGIEGQVVRAGSALQVQLPGNPAVWTFDEASSVGVEPRGRTLVFSPGRIKGTKSLFVFDFALAKDFKPGDEGRIVLTSSDPPKALDKVLPGGRFEIAFTVIP